MKFDVDFFGNMEYLNIYICETDKSKIGALTCTNPSITLKSNDINELDFKVTRYYIDHLTGKMELNPYYDFIEPPRVLYVDRIGYFQLQKPTISMNGLYEEKSCKAISLQYQMTQRMIYELEINTGSETSTDDVIFYNPEDMEHSLLHLVLEQYPNWNIRHVDLDLAKQKRSFSLNNQNVYSVLTKNISESFKCLFIFDTFTNEIDAFTEEQYGMDTNVYISHENLAKSIQVSYNDDDIKTVLKCRGDSDFNFREINFGSDTLINLSYFHTIDFMGPDLYNAWSLYLDLQDEQIMIHQELMLRNKELLNELSELSNRQPESSSSTDWTEYGLVMLKSKFNTYQKINQTQAAAGWGNVDSKEYPTYLANYELMKAVEAELAIRQAEWDTKDEERKQVIENIYNIADVLSIENNFTDQQMKRLIPFLKESEYSDDCFLITEDDNDDDILETQQAFLEASKKELEKVCRPKLDFSMDMSNILALSEFQEIVQSFDLGNYITVEIRPDYLCKVRILEISFQLNNPTSLNARFGDATKYMSLYDQQSSILDEARAQGNTLNHEKSYWEKGTNTANAIYEQFQKGLDASVTQIKSSDNMDVLIDTTGMHLRRINPESGTIDPREVWMTGSQILFSDDNFKSAKTALGEVHIDGKRYYGVIAEMVVAGIIKGTEIIGGTITSENYISGEQGSYLDLNTGDWIGGSITSNNYKEGVQGSNLDLTTGEWTGGILKSNNYKEGATGSYLDLNTGAWNGGIITGTTVNASTFIGGVIKSTNYDSSNGTQGSHLDLNSSVWTGGLIQSLPQKDGRRMTINLNTSRISYLYCNNYAIFNEGIELVNSTEGGGYVDFRYKNENIDYTSRIIEKARGGLYFETLPGGNGYFQFSSPTYINASFTSYGEVVMRQNLAVAGWIQGSSLWAGQIYVSGVQVHLAPLSLRKLTLQRVRSIKPKENSFDILNEGVVYEHNDVLELALSKDKLVSVLTSDVEINNGTVKTGVNYTAVSNLLWKCTQELHYQNLEQSKQIESLISSVDTLQQKLETMKG